MQAPLIVTLARLREAADLYRQLAAARRDQDAGLQRDRDLADLAAEYGEDLDQAAQAERLRRGRARDLEHELQQLEARLQDRRSRRSEDPGTVMALAAEIDALQRRRDELEGRLLDQWQEDQTVERALADEKEAAGAVRRELERKREVLQTRRRRAERAVPEIGNDLDHLMRRLPRPVAGRLARIARRHADPVADLREGACGGCGQALPMQEAVDADREAALVVCQGCGRYVVARSGRLAGG